MAGEGGFGMGFGDIGGAVNEVHAGSALASKKALSPAVLKRKRLGHVWDTNPEKSVAASGGNSGGAVLDMSGSVIGVANAQLNAIAKSVPQNVNFAIQTPIVVNFLLVKGATPEFGTWSAGADRPASEVADIAKKFTVQVYCQGISPKTATGSAGPLALSPSDFADFGAKFDAESTPGRGSTRP